MQFVREPWSVGAPKLATQLVDALERQDHVVWLVSGGSNIQIATEVMRELPEHLTRKLVIMLADERYGDVGHKDSNFQQLQEVGFEPKLAEFIPTLIDGLSLEDTAAEFGQRFTREADNAGAILAQFGIGSDGHVAGILPHSPASTSDRAAFGYHTEQYNRITLTFNSLKRIHTAYAFVYGDDKAPTLKQLQTEDLELTEQPAQILKQIPDVYIYNDQRTEEETA